MKDKIKEVETFLRQYGIEGEEAFLALTAFYLRIHNPQNSSQNLNFFKEKGEALLSKVNNDLIVIAKLEEYVSNDIKGNSLPVAYQYFHSKKFRDNTGKFFTPREVAEAMGAMLTVHPNSVIFDPACGGGTFLLSALERWDNHPVHLIGNDVDKSLVFLTELLLLINNTNPNNKFSFSSLNLYTEFSNLKKYFNKVDCILANPPFSIPIKSIDVTSPLFNLGYSNSDALFIDLCYNLLKENGKLVCLVPHSLVANKEFLNFRKEIEKYWTIKGIFILPEGVFNATSNTTTRADIIILNKGTSLKKSNKIVFGNVSKVGIPTTQKEKSPIENELKKILEINTIQAVLN